MSFNVGDKIKITGDWEDSTDHLDGKIGTIIAVNVSDVEVTVKGEPFTWMIWNHNATKV